MSRATSPVLTVHWVLEDVETEEPRVTHYLHQTFGRASAWPRVGDRISPPPGINAHAADGTAGGKVTDVAWSRDVDEVEVWVYAHAHDITDEALAEAQAVGWLYGSVSVSGKGADDY